MKNFLKNYLKLEMLPLQLTGEKKSELKLVQLKLKINKAKQKYS